VRLAPPTSLRRSEHVLHKGAEANRRHWAIAERIILSDVGKGPRLGALPFFGESVALDEALMTTERARSA